MVSNYKNFRIELFRDDSYTPGSADNVITYKKIYSGDNNERFTDKIGLKVFLDENEISSAVICEHGIIDISENSYIIKNDMIFICCGSDVYALNLPHLSLNWNKELDMALCFSIYEFEEDFIIQGELNISRLTEDGVIKWQFSGRDCFVALDNRKNFEIIENTIRVTDFQNYQYILGEDGKEIF